MCKRHATPPAFWLESDIDTKLLCRVALGDTPRHAVTVKNLSAAEAVVRIDSHCQGHYLTYAKSGRVWRSGDVELQDIDVSRDSEHTFRADLQASASASGPSRPTHETVHIELRTRRRIARRMHVKGELPHKVTVV